MLRSALLCVALFCSACGPLNPQKTDGGTGGGGGSLFGGGTGGTGGSGGGTTTGGGAGGGTGGGTTGGGTGGGTTGGGAGGGAALAPLAWAAMAMTGVTSTSYVVGLGGTATDLWAVQDTGSLFHSTGGAFNFLFSFSSGVKGIYAAGGTVVVIGSRSIRTCTANCTTAAAFATFQLLNSPLNYNLYDESVCGRGPNDITVIVSDSTSSGQVFHWDGSTWTRTNATLGVDYPNGCWFDSAGVLYVAGQDAVVRSESGATTVDPLSSNFTGYNAGTDLAGTSWIVGPSSYMARRLGSTWTPLTSPTPTSLYTVAGLSQNEVYALGYFNSAIGNGYKWNGTALSPMGMTALPNTGMQSAIRSSLVTAPNELYLGGSNQAGPIILRGRR